MSNFDPDAAERAKREALDRVDEHADGVWKDAAYQAVSEIARTRSEFTTDRVWWLLERWGAGRPREPRAMGAIMRKAALDGVIVKTDRVHVSVRVANHRRPVAVWESRIFGEDP